MNKTLFLLLASWTCFSQAKISYKKTDGLLDITSYIAYMADSSEKLTFEQVRNLPASAFKFNNKVGLNLGNTDLPYWFHIAFKDTLFTEDLFLTIGVNARLLDVFVIYEGGIVEQSKSGFLRPIGGGYFLTNKNTYNLKRNPESVYFRLESTIMNTNFYISSIQPLYNNNHLNDLFIGGILAIILALGIYNLFLFFSLNDKIFLYYSLMTFSILYINIRWQGLQHELYWTENSLFTPDNLSSLFIANAFAILFITNFLNSKNLSPKLHFLMLLFLFAQLLLVPYDWSENKRVALSLTYYLQIGLCLIVFIAGIYIWRLGYKPAKYFTIAWFFYITGLIFLYLGKLGILSINNFWIRYAWQIGNVIEVLLTSFAVAYRFNLFRQEARDAQALVLQRSGENEQLLLAHNQILEEKLQLEEKISNQKPNHKVDDLLERLQSERGKNKKLAVSTIEGVLLLPIPDIIRLEALGSYCNIYLTNNKKIIASKNLAEFEPMLDKNDFLRIHKSHIVNINFVERYIRGEGGMVIMPDGAEVSVSRTMKAELLERLNIQ